MLLDINNHEDIKIKDKNPLPKLAAYTFNYEKANVFFLNVRVLKHEMIQRLR